MKINDIKVSDNFKLYEFECHDGNHEVVINPALITKLQKLRDYIKRPIIITSGYRTPEYNRKVGGVVNSQHVKGTAADIIVNGLTPDEVAMIAEKIRFDGIGIYRKQNFVHVDVRGYRARWQDTTKQKMHTYRKSWYTHVLEINPLTLCCAVVNNYVDNLPYENFVNGTFYGKYQGEYVAISNLVSDGKIITKRLPHDQVKRAHFIVYWNGEVEVRMIKDLEELDLNNVKFCISGFNMFPIDLEKEWWPLNIGRSCMRVCMGYNPKKKKVIIAARNNSNAERAQLTLKNLGCNKGIGLDSGSPATFKVDSKYKVKNTSWLNNIIYF